MGSATAIRSKHPRPAPAAIDELYAEIKELAAENDSQDWLRRHLMTAKRALNGGNKADLKKGATASSDYEATLLGLGPAAMTEIAERDDPWAAAERRGIEQLGDLLGARGGCIKISELARRKKVTPQAIHQQRKRGQLIAIDAGRKEMLIPLWQFGRNLRPLSGLAHTLAELKSKGLEAWDIFIFFLTPSHALHGQAPIDALISGNLAGVQRLARLYDQHGAL